LYFSFGHCVVCSSSIYGFGLPLWYQLALFEPPLSGIFWPFVTSWILLLFCHMFVSSDLLSRLGIFWPFNHVLVSSDLFSRLGIFWPFVTFWYILTFCHVKRACWYQRGNPNPYIEEEQTTQWPKEKYKKTNNDLLNIHIKLKIE
jgi:hypothetical protein